MDDLISRQALLESIERISVKGNVLDDDWIYRFIQEFPSAQTVDKDINVPINDIISRQAAIKAICDDGTWLESQGCTEITMAERKQRDADILGELPSVQPEIIRCRDCKNWDKTWTSDWSPEYHYCPMIDGVRKGDFYCADAERRTDE